MFQGETIKPPTPAPQSAVSMTVGPIPRPRSRRRRYIFITVRPDLLEGGLPWWIKGATVSLALGTGPDAGRILLKPGGEHVLLGAARNDRVAFVKFEAFKGMPPMRQPRTDVVFDYHPEWLDITLPTWPRGLEENKLVRAMGLARGTAV